MKTNFTDATGIIYTFEFNTEDVLITTNSREHPAGVMPIEQVANNSEPWQFLKSNHIKMSPDAIEFLEKYCQNKAFW